MDKTTNQTAQVVIFAKAPVAGTVKTRLAAAIGDAAALEVYRRMLWGCTDRLAQGPWHVQLAVTPDATATQSDDWPQGVARLPQGDGDLGDRMMRFLQQARPDAPVLVVGSDIPALSAPHIAQALSALDRNDLVFGPCVDGGFYLVGARMPPKPDLFAQVTWSAPTTLDQVIARCAVPPALIDRLDDFDDMDSYRRHRLDPAWSGLVPQKGLA